MKTTLRDIARHTGVHISTVSHILNNAGGNTRASSETRERVLQSARDLGYTVNRAAQQLKTRRGRVIGVLVGALENPFFARMVSHCGEALEQRGYDMVLAVRRNDETDDLHLLEALVSRRLDGLLLWSETVTQVRERIQQPDMAHSVVMGFGVPGRDSVAGNLHTGVRAALEHLAAQGRQRIGYLAPQVALQRAGDPRTDLYCHFMTERGQKPRLYPYEGTAFDMASPRARAEAIGRGDEQPDALLCFNDTAAIGALMGLRRAGLRVPCDIALVGCDDTPLAAQMDVPLTCVAYPLAEMCRLAVDRLLERIAPNDGSAPPLTERHTMIPTVLHIRESSACAASGAGDCSAAI